MYNLHILHDGALPVSQKRIHTGEIAILRCDYWALQVWSHRNLAAPFWRVYWNRGGGGEVEHNGVITTLKPGNIVLISPNTHFTTRLIDGNQDDNLLVGCPITDETVDGVRHFFIHFIAGMPYDAVKSGIFTIPAFCVEQLLTKACEDIVNNEVEIGYSASFSLKSLIYYALSAVPDDVWPVQIADERVRKVVKLIDENFTTRLTNDDFAIDTNMTWKALVRLFKKYTNETPQEYLKHRRLEHASMLLHHTDTSIESVAAQCGFCDRHHFTKMFQQQYNIGPASYRKNRMP